MRLKLLPLIKSFLLVIAIMVMSILGFGELLGGAAPTSLDTTASTSIPTIAYTSGGQQVQAPDWSKISFSSLPPIESPGWIDFQQSLIRSLGYDPSRVWFAGDRPNQFVMLGDVAEAFHMEAFNLKDISGLSGLAIESLTLNDFGLTQWQTPKSLLKAIGSLGNLPVSQIAPFRDLLDISGVKLNGSVASVVRTNPTFANSPLVKLDLNKYSLGSIPGLTKTPIGKFAGWQQSFIAQVPGLSYVPFSQFPIPLKGSSIRIATTDLVWSAAEHGDGSVPPDLYISGTVNKKDKTVPVPCKPNQPCAYIELSDPLGINAPLHGKRWVSGKIQKVKGGFGPLAKVNNGWEPAGKLVFGPAFKVVLTDTDESQGEANFALYLRACVNIPFYGKSCTPYFIGGIPWLPTSETGFVIVATAKPNVNVDSKYQQQIASIEQSNQPQTSNPHSEQSNQQAGDSAASQEASPTDGILSANARIMAAINNLGSFPSNVTGTNGGRSACLWAVNRVIKEAGLAPLANDSLWVLDAKASLDQGRGQKINIANAQPGDIVLVNRGGSSQHIGFCLNNGCTQTISNSSSNASFSFRGNSNFSYPGSPYNGATPQVYRLKK